MSQNSIQLPTSGTLGGLQGITDINAALDTLNTKWSGAGAPAEPEFGQDWLDTSTTPATLRRFDGVQWVAVGTLDATKHAWQPASLPTPSTSSGVQEFLRVTADKSAYELATPSAALTEMLGGSPLAGFRNRIINGDMRVAQRGTGGFANANGYTLDRMYCNRDGGVGNLTVGQEYGAFSTTRNWLSLQRVSGDTQVNGMNVYQAIEATNTQDFAGQTVTMSVLAGATGNFVGDSFNLQLGYQTGASDQGPGGTWTWLAGASFTLTGSPQHCVQSFALPAGATQICARIQLLAPAGTAGANDYAFFTDWQLEASPVATPFEQRPVHAEMLLCYRYYEKMIGRIVSGYSSTGPISLHWFFKATKRASPSVYYGDEGTNLNNPEIYTDLVQTGCNTNTNGVIGPNAYANAEL